jgi:hypothetical protein
VLEGRKLVLLNVTPNRLRVFMICGLAGGQHKTFGPERRRRSNLRTTSTGLQPRPHDQSWCVEQVNAVNSSKFHVPVKPRQIIQEFIQEIAVAPHARVRGCRVESLEHKGCALVPTPA